MLHFTMVTKHDGIIHNQQNTIIIKVHYFYCNNKSTIEIRSTKQSRKIK